MRASARRLRSQLAGFDALASSRLARPAIGSQTVLAPAGTNWSCRPSLWSTPLVVPAAVATSTETRLDPSSVLFLPSRTAEVTWRQYRSTRPESLAPFGLVIETFAFDGDYLSLALDFPPPSLAGLTEKSLVHLGLDFSSEYPVRAAMQLNLRDGPNVYSLRQNGIDPAEPDLIGFDLLAEIPPSTTIDHVWLDIILERPEMNRFDLRDVVFLRRNRAEI